MVKEEIFKFKGEQVEINCKRNMCVVLGKISRKPAWMEREEVERQILDRRDGVGRFSKLLWSSLDFGS